MTIFNIDPDSDIVVSKRPYQDVIAINDLSDLDSFETRQRKRQAAENAENCRFPWLRTDVIQDMEDRKKYFRNKVSNWERQVRKILAISKILKIISAN
ncbi:uncharacterized protein NPIL_308531 [Nephila pilipes]|uniref:Uncharacterized protein n=1 Tax=Nephila pilipes TaxID=299642 RepID=A0A8X6TYI4_NEPPI|nr:uncharacterized protein NPIL_308531 [Nephila pilipes]